ncbi:MAG: UxaA family hydrolase [Promethearchaeota archaeon]
MKKKYILLNSKDNCATVLEDLPKNSDILFRNRHIILNHLIPLGHKFALVNIPKGEYIIKYGEIIGVATEDIKKGDWIHTHNIKSAYLEVVNCE